AWRPMRSRPARATRSSRSGLSASRAMAAAIRTHPTRTTPGWCPATPRNIPTSTSRWARRRKTLPPARSSVAKSRIVTRSSARELGIKPLARVVATGLSALEPEFMGLGPIDASKQALKRAGMSIDDVDIVEINEAFAAQVIPSARGIGVDPFSEKLNPHGGAIALGHPFGMTGARILCTLLNGLRERDKTFGLETMCVGGGQGMAMILERLN